MKNYRKALAALVLALLLSAPAVAGVIHTGITEPPPPEQRAGEIHTGKAASTLEIDTVTKIALSLLQNLLPLF